MGVERVRNNRRFNLSEKLRLRERSSSCSRPVVVAGVNSLLLTVAHYYCRATELACLDPQTDSVGTKPPNAGGVNARSRVRGVDISLRLADSLHVHVGVRKSARNM